MGCNASQNASNVQVPLNNSLDHYQKCIDEATNPTIKEALQKILDEKKKELEDENNKKKWMENLTQEDIYEILNDVYNESNAKTFVLQAREPSVTKVPSREPSVTKVPSREPSVTKVPSREPSVTKVPSREPSVTKVPSRTQSNVAEIQSKILSTLPPICSRNNNAIPVN